MLPAMIDRYEIRSELGRGGMAEVYLAHDPRFDRLVAIKVLPRQLLADEELRLRFKREARYIAAVEHTAIVPVHDFGEVDGQPYLVMRHMPGGSLQDRLNASGPLPPAEVCRLLQRLAPALDHAHRRGVIHRDLKPGNILFDEEGEAYLTDFGIAKRILSETTTPLTATNISLGTPAYMSPEQVRGEPDIDHRTDIYSLGAILFEMLTGRIPYDAATPTGRLMRHLTDPVPKIHSFRPELPPACQALIDRSLAKLPADRYPTAGELARHAQDVLAGPALPPAPPGETNPHESSISQDGALAWLRRRWKLAVFSLLALFLIFCLGGGALAIRGLLGLLAPGETGAPATGTRPPPSTAVTLPVRLGAGTLVSVDGGELLAGPENVASPLSAGRSFLAGPQARLEIPQGHARLDLSDGARVWLGDSSILWVPGVAGPDSTAEETILELEQGLLLIKSGSVRIRAREAAFQVEGGAIMGITCDLPRGRFLVDCLDGVCKVGLGSGSSMAQIPSGMRGGFEGGELVELQVAQEHPWRELAGRVIDWSAPAASPSPTRTLTPSAAPSLTPTASLTASPTVTTGAVVVPTDTPRPRAPRPTATRKPSNTKPPPKPPTKTPVNP